MAFVAVPGPFDFALTTERFRAFGVDRATVWHEGGLHRVVAGVVGLPFELEPFYAWAAADEVLATVVHRLRGFRPSLAADPFEMLVGAITAQQVSLYAATAIRNRMIEAYGRRVGAAWEFPSRAVLASLADADLVGL